MFNNYLKPGKGVEKNEKPKTAMGQFFFTAGTNFKKMLTVNIVNLIAFIPLMLFLLCVKKELNISAGYGYIYNILSFVIAVVLGIPPFSAGVNYVMYLFAKDEHVFISDIFDSAKANIRQSMGILAVNIFAVYIFAVNYKFYFIAGIQADVLKILFISAFVLFLTANMYIYQLMIKFRLSFFTLYKKAFVFAVLLLPQNILILLFIAFIGALCFSLNNMLGYILSGLLFFSFSSLILNIFVHRIIEKYSVS